MIREGPPFMNVYKELTYIKQTKVSTPNYLTYQAHKHCLMRYKTAEKDTILL